jgi:hypothetical protein
MLSPKLPGPPTLPLDSRDGRGHCAKRKVAQRRVLSRLQFNAHLALEYGSQALRAIRALWAGLLGRRQPKICLLGGIKETPKYLELLVREDAVGMQLGKERR